MEVLSKISPLQDTVKLFWYGDWWENFSVVGRVRIFYGDRGEYPND